jgi:DNA-directed RNA polymerase specialized sigma24 family protein
MNCMTHLHLRRASPALNSAPTLSALKLHNEANTNGLMLRRLTMLRKTRRREDAMQGRPWDRMMVAVQDGDRETYRRLFCEVAEWLRAYFSTRVSSCPVERLVQITLIAIHDKRHTYEPSRAFETWLTAIAQYQFTHRRDAEAEGVRASTCVAALQKQSGAPFCHQPTGPNRPPRFFEEEDRPPPPFDGHIDVHQMVIGPVTRTDGGLANPVLAVEARPPRLL